MTKLSMCGWFRFAPVQYRKAGAMEMLSLSTVVSIVSMLCITSTIASAQTYTVLASFNVTNGANPSSSLIQGLDGNFYGTTELGGANGDGTVFKITSGGTLTTLHSFNGSDGGSPEAGLAQATVGNNLNFYGTTELGGANDEGMVFKITPGGTLTTLPSFSGPDGVYPTGGLVQESNASFYGTTSWGGANFKGSVFAIAPGGGGILTTLHSFNGPDGAYPWAGVVWDYGAYLYGITQYGGANGYGTVFKMIANPSKGGMLTTLHSFDLGPDGAYPSAGLVQGTDGNFYGTTYQTGPHDYLTCVPPENCFGTVFKITPAGILTTLHSFNGTDGANPWAGLVQGSDGNFYGTTVHGGANNVGTVFKITPGGTETVLHSFDLSPDGGYTMAGLVQGTDGNFYGTTFEGGVKGVGTVFRLSVGLGPFVTTRPFYGAWGASIIILGNNLTGTTAVSFNDIAAKFTVVSSTEITATVPSGATTGKVQVTTPSGTLTSNVNFRALKPAAGSCSGPQT